MNDVLFTMKTEERSSQPNFLCFDSQRVLCTPISGLGVGAVLETGRFDFRHVMSFTFLSFFPFPLSHKMSVLNMFLTQSCQTH